MRPVTLKEEPEVTKKLYELTSENDFEYGQIMNFTK